MADRDPPRSSRPRSTRRVTGWRSRWTRWPSARTPQRIADDVKAAVLRFVKKPPVAAALAGVSVVTIIVVVRRIRNG